MTKIRIESDFRDYYDHAFCGAWETPDFTYERMSTGGMSRPAMFVAFESVGLNTPRHGLVRDLIPELKKEYAGYCEHLNLKVVVHTSEYAHAGEGKELLAYDQAMKKRRNAFAVEFIPTALGNNHATSYRYLRVGTRVFWMEYESQDDWRSNCGDCSVKYLSESADTVTAEAVFFRESPLLALDFLKVGQKMLAIDLNVAPGLRGTGIEKIMKPDGVYQEVQNWYRNTNV
ncbi:hypothetical protein [Acidithiobacillus ferrooxidans]|jgi:hypothetical protein|uniref:Uncharacterized protein n=1 Tax=Acidithiobacillus ferrooxidans TaxID=920 RepID=A0A2W1KLZ1_ACIFR|nr:hypothetical protein [Acidithiobacillus ferrooxidans]MBU2774756.1 hypothetical protein [Acidithiobacillus ferrooxidans]MBU2816791.1 hypothetical protein [Acidithiobacillus ferrooxidans]MCR0969973.1 hypothetical protein [Acidithiobacillus ferrooxidans]MCR1342720.1 hypothetical protein [Acidithiobacillus ferrooxidans]MCR1347915.1 hypothetical protein [Acidithiobacillus ferrooxidans]